jgi:allantoicase
MHDWVVLRLAAEAEIERVELDTSNFKGNFPDSCSLDARSGLESAGEPEWSEALSHRRLGPHRRFAFPIDPSARASHVRLNIHPDGGVARLRHPRARDDEAARASACGG